MLPDHEWKSRARRAWDIAVWQWRLAGGHLSTNSRGVCQSPAYQRAACAWMRCGNVTTAPDDTARGL